MTQLCCDGNWDFFSDFVFHLHKFNYLLGKQHHSSYKYLVKLKEKTMPTEKPVNEISKVSKAGLSYKAMVSCPLIADLRAPGSQ